MKSYLLILDLKAVEDIQDASDYYKGIYGNLSDRFELAVKSTIDQIKQNPFYQIKYNNIRVLHLKKFPYAIHYEVDEKQDEIRVLALVHTAADPDKIWMWQEE